MSTNDTYLAVFLGGGTNSAKRVAWDALPEAERNAKMQQGMAAWKAWIDKHQSAIVQMGGPLGKTRKVDSRGVAEVTNLLTAFSVVRVARGCSEDVRGSPALFHLSGRGHRDHAGSADTGRLNQSMIGNQCLGSIGGTAILQLRGVPIAFRSSPKRCLPRWFRTSEKNGHRSLPRGA
jgi:hypothetical protein